MTRLFSAAAFASALALAAPAWAQSADQLNQQELTRVAPAPGAPMPAPPPPGYAYPPPGYAYPPPGYAYPPPYAYYPYPAYDPYCCGYPAVGVWFGGGGRGWHGRR